MKKKYFLLLFVALLLSTGCTSLESEPKSEITQLEELDHNQLITAWPNTVFYEIFVRSFYDSTGDGIGDINGMTEKLDYLQQLGIEGVWLMPINPSPSYHGYDVTDYYDIHPDYGTMADFKNFLNEAHKRNIKVVIDLVVNHSSIEHPWFKNAISSPTSEYRDWFIWANEKTNLRERGEWGQPHWHGNAPNHYMSVFWEGMPDLNFENQEVREEMKRIGQFWLDDVGVDGFRLDAAKHIFSDKKEENLIWWKEFRTAMEEVNPDVFLVGEVWDIPQVTGPYLDKGLHSTFNFDLAENILNAARSEQGGTLVANLIRSLTYFEAYSDDFIDSTFITNHDMNRVMSELRGNQDRGKMAASLLLTLPGSPFIYYGEEIGMEGQKPDEHIREPMLWFENNKTNGQTTWIKPKYNQANDATSVEEQWQDDGSLLNHYQKMIYLRRTEPALLQGNIDASPIKEKGIIAFKRSYNEEELHVIHNLSKNEIETSLEDENIRISFATKDDYHFEDGVLKIPSYSTIIITNK